MKIGKLFIAVIVSYVLVAVLDVIANLFILGGAWQSVVTKGILPTAQISVGNGFWYLIILAIPVTIMGFFYAYGGKVLGTVTGKFWLGFGCGTLVNVRLLTQFVFTEIPFSIVALGLIVNWIGFVAAAYLIAKLYGPGDWATA